MEDADKIVPIEDAEAHTLWIWEDRFHIPHGRAGAMGKGQLSLASSVMPGSRAVMMTRTPPLAKIPLAEAAPAAQQTLTALNVRGSLATKENAEVWTNPPPKRFGRLGLLKPLPPPIMGAQSSPSAASSPGVGGGFDTDAGMELSGAAGCVYTISQMRDSPHSEFNERGFKAVPCLAWVVRGSARPSGQGMVKESERTRPSETGLAGLVVVGA